ncbi:MAG: hypothetical protein AAGE94_17825, partial [Acidobacteriota bacterium]
DVIGLYDDPDPEAYRHFPYPVGGPFRNHSDPIRRSAEARELDGFWDLLLEQATRDLVGVDQEARRSVKEDVVSREHGMREAFRMSLFRHDWGHLNHCLDAARFEWHAWLSTNYTRFADRAVELDLASQKRDQTVRSWRTVASLDEARWLQRELLHQGDVDVRRTLFKLHGDITHLQTMAIAGHDKEIATPLLVPVDSLHEIYTVATQYLTRTLRQLTRGETPERCATVFHVVGHDLKDEMLVDLVDRVCRRCHGERRFCVVQPDEGARRTAEVLRTQLDSSHPKSVRFYFCELTAQAYLARIRTPGRWGDSPSTVGAAEVDDWLQSLGAQPLSDAESRATE